MSIPKTADEAIAWVEAPNAEAVEIGRVPAVAISADPDVARQHARDLADHPVYTAKYGPRSTVITHEAFQSLKSLGAKCPVDL
jgi:hypothetical protein